MTPTTAFTEATLQGLRHSLKTNLSLKKLPLVTTDNAISVFRKDFVKYGSSVFPYAYLKLNDFTIDKENYNSKTIGRRGTGISTDSITNSLIAKNYQFPTILTFTLSYYSNDFGTMLGFIEKFDIYNVIQAFNYAVDLPKATRWVVDVSAEPQISIPTATLEDEQLPAVYPLEIPLVVKSKTGLVKDVPKTNNQGHIKTSVKVTSTGNHNGDKN